MFKYMIIVYAVLTILLGIQAGAQTTTPAQTTPSTTPTSTTPPTTTPPTTTPVPATTVPVVDNTTTTPDLTTTPTVTANTTTTPDPTTPDPTTTPIPTTTPVDDDEMTTDTWCETGKINNDLCCSKECNSCGKCYKNGTSYNNFMNTQCCGTYIRTNYPLCNFTMPPCILFNNGTHIVDDDGGLEFWIIIALSIGGGLFLLLVFVCVSFPKERQPELDYSHIRGKMS